MGNKGKRHVIVGTGNRASMYFRALTDTFADRNELVGLCDVNQTRMDYWNGRLAEAGKPPVPTFQADRFDEMIGQVRPDTVIVCTRDCDHDRYIVRAMELGCDVITEKPMTTDETRCARVLEAIERTGRKCTVTFNARYGPSDTKVKELLSGGIVGRVHSVMYEHLLDIRHGADYFRRWHRDKANSGGLMVHKCTHCFDLVNWWLDDEPSGVVASGGTRFYGPQGLAAGSGCFKGLSPFSGRLEEGDRPSATAKGGGQSPLPQEAGQMEAVPEYCRTCRLTDSCRFYFDLASMPTRAALFLGAEREDGYYRDQCVFGEGITTEDTVAVIVNYRRGAILSYHLSAFSPYEGSRIVFNGQTGRLEVTETASTQWLVAGADGETETIERPAGTRIEVFPHHAPSYTVDYETVKGGHGGADTRIVADLFGPPRDGDPLGHKADHFDGARSILIGIAANRSMERGRPVTIGELVKLPRR